MIAYLVVREGNKWRDVYRLTPGQIMTIGRAPTNRIVLHDEVCSRYHCEVFQTGSTWKIRDLQSRNGTLIGGEPVEGEVELKPGQVIEIGPCELAFTYDLSQAFPRSGSELKIENETGAPTIDVLDMAPPPAEPTILHREAENPYVAGNRAESLGRDRTSRELAQLYRLALDMGGANNSKQLAEIVLSGLSSGTSADIGALLLLPNPVSPGEEAGELTLVAYRSSGERPYQKVSEYLSTTVLKSREAILAFRTAALAEPDIDCADPRDGKDPSAGPNHFRGARLSPGHNRRDALLHVPPDGRPDGRRRRDDGRAEDGAAAVCPGVPRARRAHSLSPLVLSFHRAVGRSRHELERAGKALARNRRGRHGRSTRSVGGGL